MPSHNQRTSNATKVIDEAFGDPVPVPIEQFFEGWNTGQRGPSNNSTALGQLERMNNLLKKLTYKPGSNFEAALTGRGIIVHITLTVIGVHDRKRSLEDIMHELWGHNSREDYYEFTANEIPVHRRTYSRSPQRLFGHATFDHYMLSVLKDEDIYRDLKETVRTMELHEVDEFFRVDDVCTDDPHPEITARKAEKGII